MRYLSRLWLRVGKSVHGLAGVILAAMFVLTLCEVTGRFLGRPIPGSYELISFMGGLVIGFSVPYTSQKRGHVNVDFLVVKFSESRQRAISVVTRAMAMIFLALAGVSLLYMGANLIVKHEVSQTLKLPLYPVAFGIGLVFLIQAFQFVIDIWNLTGGRNG